MSDLAVSQHASLPASRARLSRSYRTDRLFHRLTLASAMLVLVMFGGIIWSLTAGAWPAISAFGLPFLWTEAWNPVTEKFGALAPIYGTLVTSAIAMLISVPVGI